jgi:hypothetical protein
LVPVLFHYTSRAAAQSILISGKLEPGISGWAYLTPDTYDTGWQAAQRLATPAGQPREVAFALPQEQIEQICTAAGYSDDLSPHLVEPVYLDGELLRPGVERRSRFGLRCRFLETQ